MTESTFKTEFSRLSKTSDLLLHRAKTFCGLSSHTNQNFMAQRCVPIVCSEAVAILIKAAAHEANKRRQVARGGEGVAVSSQLRERDKCCLESGWLISCSTPNSELKCWLGPHVSAVHRFKEKSVQNSPARAAVLLYSGLSPQASRNRLWPAQREFKFCQHLIQGFSPSRRPHFGWFLCALTQQ